MKTTLYRSRTDSMIGGVCGGLGRYLGIDPTLVRFFFVLMVLLGFGTGLLIYLVLWLVVPLEGYDPAMPLDARMRSGAEEMAQQAQNLGNRVQGTPTGNPQAAVIIGSVLR